MSEKETESALKRAGTNASFFDLLGDMGLNMNKISDSPGEKLRFWTVDASEPDLPFTPVFKTDEMSASFNRNDNGLKKYSEGRLIAAQVAKKEFMVVFTGTEGNRPSKPALVAYNPKLKIYEAVRVDIASKSFVDKVKDWFKNLFASTQEKETRAQTEREALVGDPKLSYTLDNIQAQVDIIHGRMGGNSLQEKDAEKISATVVDAREMGRFVETMAKMKNAPVAENHPKRVAAGLTLAYLHKNPKQFGDKQKLLNLPKFLMKLPSIQKMATSLSAETFLAQLKNPETQRTMMNAIARDIKNVQKSNQIEPQKTNQIEQQNMEKHTEPEKEKTNQKQTEQAVAVVKRKPSVKGMG